MMTLDTMSAIMLACEGQHESPMIRSILSRWRYDQGSVRFVRVSANCVFTFQAGEQAYYLRFNHMTERNVGTIQAEMDFIHALLPTGVRIAAPVPSMAGNYIERVPTPCGDVLAVVFEALPGKSYGAISELSPELLACWGRALGTLHQESQGYPSAPHRPTWQDHMTLITADLPKDDAAAWTVLQQVRDQLGALPVCQDNYGLIHYDFELDNIIWEDDTPGIIDFDDCAWYWFAADIAFALRDLFDNQPACVDLNHRAFRAFIAGYRQARAIDDAELQHIPLFLRLHNLSVYAKLRRTLAAGKQACEPTWMDGLRTKLSHAMQRYHGLIVDIPPEV